MSKPPSGLFSGTKGEIAFHGDAESIVTPRITGLDLREHPIKMKQLNSKQRNFLKQKENNRTMTREEYKRYKWNERFKSRRDSGVKAFWNQEKDRLARGEKGTRNWTEEQREDILAGKTPKYNGKPMEAHHSYSTTVYPHLSNRGEIIYPATHTEHRKGWHDGSYSKSQPGKRIHPIKEF